MTEHKKMETKEPRKENEFLKKHNESMKNGIKRKKKDLLEGFAFKDGNQVALNQYITLDLSLYESKTTPGILKLEMKIAKSRLVFDAKMTAVIREAMKDLTDVYIPNSLKPQSEGSL